MEWKKIRGYENYEVSDTGLVRTWNQGRGRSRDLLSCPKLKSVYTIRDMGDYRFVTLSFGGKKKHFKVARLVLFAFRGDPGPGEESSHLDGNCRNDNLDNLAWETSERNNQRNFEHGKVKVTNPKSQRRLFSHLPTGTQVGLLAKKSIHQTFGYRWERGLCQRCGEKRNHYARLCDKCQVEGRIAARKRLGFNPWKPGTRGPIPRVQPGV